MADYNKRLNKPFLTLMSVTFDWGAVVAIVTFGGAIATVLKFIVRDEIRAVTNGKFGKIDQRLSSLEVGMNVLEDREGVRHRVGYKREEGDE